MKEITAKNANATVIYRVDGRDVYLKANSLQYTSQLINQIEKKGGSVKVGRSWIKCDIFGSHEVAKLGGITLDLKEAAPSTIEDSLTDFFSSTLNQAGFKTSIKEIEQ